MAPTLVRAMVKTMELANQEYLITEANMFSFDLNICIYNFKMKFFSLSNQSTVLGRHILLFS